MVEIHPSHRDYGVRVEFENEQVARLSIFDILSGDLIEPLERVEILRGLRLGDFDVLVGINLLREGLDLPEVSLVAVLDADKEGFLRDARSLIQTAGRAARIRDKIKEVRQKIDDEEWKKERRKRLKRR